MGKTFNNLITETEVSIAIEQLLIAPFPTTYAPARIDVAAPPAGFFHLGAVVEDTPSLSSTRTKFQLDAGIPAVRQYEAVIGLEGTFEVSLHSNSWRKIQYALGNITAISSATVIATISSVTNAGQITLSGSPSAAMAVGDQITIAADLASVDNPDATETFVSSINGPNITLVPVLATTPSAGNVVADYAFVRQAYGTSQLKNFALLGVADFIDGVQVVHSIPKVAPGEEFTEEIRPGANQRMPLTFNAFGVISSDHGTNEELIIAERFYFPANG